MRSVSGRFLTVRRFSAQVTAALVKELRQKSNAPMMDCKKALIEEGGDITKALSWLRQKGISKIAGNTERTAGEGLICMKSSPTFTTMLEINTETDYVALNKEFQVSVASITDSVAQNFKDRSGPIDMAELMASEIVSDISPELKSKTIETVVGDLISKIREKIAISKVENIVQSEGGVLAGYVHGKVGVDIIPSEFQLGKKASIMSISVSGAVLDESGLQSVQDMGRRLAMHAVAAQPTYLTQSEIPETLVSSEKHLFTEQMKEEGGKKTPEIIAKIIENKLAKRLDSMTLLGQNHVAEEGSPVIEKFLKTFSKSINADVKISYFALWQVGQQSS